MQEAKVKADFEKMMSFGCRTLVGFKGAVFASIHHWFKST
jgi:hypothetical protein